VRFHSRRRGSEKCNGDIVIHRPFLAKDLPGASGYDASYKRTAQLIRSYLAEMNIPATLGDRMLAIPPDEAQTLTREEQNLYMLNVEDPAHEQKRAAEEAHKWGISLTEQRRRQALQKEVCVWSANPEVFEYIWHSSCDEAVMRGIAPSEVQRRVQTVLRMQSRIMSLEERTKERCVGTIIVTDSQSDCFPTQKPNR
jgi:hypothetical protein